MDLSEPLLVLLVALYVEVTAYSCNSHIVQGAVGFPHSIRIGCYTKLQYTRAANQFKDYLTTTGVPCEKLYSGLPCKSLGHSRHLQVVALIIIFASGCI